MLSAGEFWCLFATRADRDWPPVALTIGYIDWARGAQELRQTSANQRNDLIWTPAPFAESPTIGLRPNPQANSRPLPSYKYLPAFRSQSKLPPLISLQSNGCVYVLLAVCNIELTIALLTATMTLTMTRPAVSSPLAQSSQSSGVPPAQRVIPKRNTSFPSSRALRPFPTISHLVQPSKAGMSSAKKPVKLIEPPKNFKATFVLDLTQAEFSRQD